MISVPLFITADCQIAAGKIDCVAFCLPSTYLSSLPSALTPPHQHPLYSPIRIGKIESNPIQRNPIHRLPRNIITPGPRHIRYCHILQPPILTIHLHLHIRNTNRRLTKSDSRKRLGRIEDPEDDGFVGIGGCGDVARKTLGDELDAPLLSCVGVDEELGGAACGRLSVGVRDDAGDLTYSPLP